ncbi:hypothetical protein V1478_007376 [Vespula squamosa]|uniref:Uncharacterized protein n=1 Tax=Vespula squamosa TaxID=30214 RepID=A0ABD2B360_VESSQ
MLKRRITGTNYANTIRIPRIYLRVMRGRSCVKVSGKWGLHFKPSPGLIAVPFRQFSALFHRARILQRIYIDH